ncbi:hypothetical protein VNO80_00899 [Phaseolus coccineus]|uniref:Uncharacterized protein n=1 Tax=Phaseolus coccineus TaxID=3886 RepID=A0AAN9P5Q1_PHACN
MSSGSNATSNGGEIKRGRNLLTELARREKEANIFLEYGKIDVVVSNAAANAYVDSILQTKDTILNKLWEINVKATRLLLKDVIPHLQKGSSIVILSSIVDYNPPPSLATYGVTKTTLIRPKLW